MTQYRWTGNGQTTDWSDSGNWSPSGVPGQADTVLFPAGMAETVTGGDTIAGITAAGGVTFDGQVFQTDGATGAFLTARAGATIAFDANAYGYGGAIAFAPTSTFIIEGTFVGTAGGTADAAYVEGVTASWTEASAVSLNQLHLLGGGVYTGDLMIGAGGSVTLDDASNLSGGTASLAGGASFYMSLPAGSTVPGAASVDENLVFQTSGSFLRLGADPGVSFTLGGDISGGGVLAIVGKGGDPTLSGTVVLSGNNSFTGFTNVQSGRLEIGSATAAGTGPIFLNDSRMLIDSAAAGGNFLIVCGAGVDVVTALAGHTVVYGPATGELAFQGGTDSSTVYGGAAIMFATGGSTGDLICGGSNADDQLSTGSGSSTIFGGFNGANVVATGTHDILFAAGGNTTLNGAGTSGNTLFFGTNSGSTIVQEGSGVDTFVGAAGATTVYAGHGVAADWLGSGPTVLDFVAGSTGGADYVYGFGANDSLTLSGLTVAGHTVSGGNTTLLLSDNTTVVLYGVTSPPHVA